MDDDDVARMVFETVSNAGRALKLPQICISTALMLIHKYVKCEKAHNQNVDSVQSNESLMSSLCKGALLLSSKLHEQPRANFLNAFTGMNNIEIERSQMIAAEMRILKTLGFQLWNEVHLPQQFLLFYCKMLVKEEEPLRLLVQESWKLCCDSFITAVCCEYDCETIACSCIKLASDSLSMYLPMPPDLSYPWWELFEVETDELNQVAASISKPHLSHN